MFLPWVLKLWCVEYEQHHSCRCPQWNSRKSCKDWHLRGEVPELPFLYWTKSWSSALAIVCGRSIITGAFPPLICAYLFILAFFHSILGLVLQAPAGVVVQSALQCPKVHVLCGKAASGSGLSWTLVSPRCKAELSAVCAVQGMTVCWPERGPSPRPLGELACTLSGNFHYLPTGQNDFAIDIGFIMSAIPFFENVGKREKEWWQGGGNSISS